MKNPGHYSSSTKLYSWHYAFGQVAFSWHWPNPDSSIGLPDGERDSSFQRMCFHCSRVPMAASFTPLRPTLGLAHGDLRLVCDCSAMETHFMNLLTNSYCADVASRGSLELGSECCSRGQMIFTHYAHPFL
jgi:hypothetical protein